MPEQGKQKRLIAFSMAYLILNNGPYLNQNVRMGLNIDPFAARILVSRLICFNGAEVFECILNETLALEILYDCTQHENINNQQPTGKPLFYVKFISKKSFT